MVQFLINYPGYAGNYINGIVSVLFLLYNVYYKSYAHLQTKNSSVLTSIVWLNLFSFLWPCLTQYNRLSELTYRALTLNIVRGFSSFLNFYLYWGFAINFLPLKFVIFGETLNEWIAVIQFLYHQNYRTLETQYPFIPYFIYCCFYSVKSLIKTEEDDENFYRNLCWSFLLITCPRMLGSYGDYLYYVYGGSGNANLDSLYSSLTILLLTLPLIVYNRIKEGRRKNTPSFELKNPIPLLMAAIRSNAANLTSLLVRADMRIAAYYINSTLGPWYLRHLDKLGFYLYKGVIMVLWEGRTLVRFLMDKDCQQYLMNSILIFFIHAANQWKPKFLSINNTSRIMALNDQVFWLLIPVIFMITLTNLFISSINYLGRSVLNYTVVKLFTWIF